ncbi:falcipain 2' [Plasmodium sp. gorilla clade G2]|uniref:falcipain 2' n=1 Tax=Plasmodium sp. gorilla clade G2 TaxID=880535 RepID=UPI000D202FF3|nr:falcipain 2' [Plasmodium sp. gorilla clade G2]SOV15517.1 falcipain 2' [Plasmodium sp. gorilla clade G2]
MDYHMDYAPNEVINQERKYFVDKYVDRKILKNKKSLLVIASLSILSIVSFVLFYFSPNDRKTDLFKNSSVENNNDDYIINSLLKSPNGKKFIVSKIDEALSFYENKMKDERKINNNNTSSDFKGLSLFKENTAENNVIFNKEYFINFFDNKFLMNNSDHINQFYMFIKTNNKQYNSPNEMKERFQVFLQNANKVNMHNNNKNSLYKKELNKFADLTYHEFKSKYLSLRPSKPLKGSKYLLDEINYEDVIKKYKREENFDHAAYDWRLHSGVTPVKDQKNCGSCWAFSSIGAVESQYAIRKNKLITLSEQELVDCSFKNYGCNGGLINNAFEDMIELGGICPDDDYPYVSDAPNLCNIDRCTEKYGIKNYLSVPDNKLKEALRFLGPISISIAVSDDFPFYKEGIFDGECGDELNHAVILVGFGMKEIVDPLTKKAEKHYYYIIKNSWGDQWGERGFINIETDESGLMRRCALGTDAFIPLIE